MDLESFDRDTIIISELAENSFKRTVHYFKENEMYHRKESFFLNFRRLLAILQTTVKEESESRNDSQTQSAPLAENITLFYTLNNKKVQILLFWNNLLNH